MGYNYRHRIVPAWDMAYITHKKRCHTCGGNDFTRYHRSLWMRMFSGSQLFRCRQCRSEILLLRNARGDAEVTPDEV